MTAENEILPGALARACSHALRAWTVRAMKIIHRDEIRRILWAEAFSISQASMSDADLVHLLTEMARRIQNGELRPASLQ